MPSTGSTQTTPLTSNSNCTAVGSGDINNSTTVMFMAPANSVSWWTTTVSNGAPKTALGSSVGNGLVTFEAGMIVQLTQLGGGSYNVIMIGNIMDNNSTTNFTGQVVYSYVPSGS